MNYQILSIKKLSFIKNWQRDCNVSYHKGHFAFQMTKGRNLINRTNQLILI